MTEVLEQAAPVKKRRKPRRGPPGVPCPSCRKLAGAEDEGQVEDLSVDASGSEDRVEVTVDATLYLTTACCGDQFKSYDLSGNSKEIDHSCAVVAERDLAQQEWDEHLSEDGEGVPNCERRRAGEAGCADKGADPDCEAGTRLRDALQELEDRITSSGDDWSVTDDGEPEAYERSQSVDRHGRPILRSRFRKSFRGFTLSTTVKHALCGQEETVDFEERDIEAPAGGFDVV